MRLKLASRRGSILASSSRALALSFSSSSRVSCMISSSSPRFSASASVRSAMISLVCSSSFFFSSMRMMASFIFLLQSSTSSDWNSISLVSVSYSRLFFTSLSCSLYFSIPACALAISPFLAVTALWNSLMSPSIFSTRVLRPSSSSAKSCTSRGNSPRNARFSSIADRVTCS